MSKRSTVVLVILGAVLAALALLGVFLYRNFVSGAIMDRGDMMNHEPRLLQPAEDAELCAVSYARGGDMEPENNFCYSLTVENGRALFSCDAFTDSGEPLQLEDVPVDKAGVTALEKTLRSMELLEDPAIETGPGGAEESTDEGRTTVYLEWTDGTSGSSAGAGEEVCRFFKELLMTIEEKGGNANGTV